MTSSSNDPAEPRAAQSALTLTEELSLLRLELLDLSHRSGLSLHTLASRGIVFTREEIATEEFGNDLFSCSSSAPTTREHIHRSSSVLGRRTQTSGLRQRGSSSAHNDSFCASNDSSCDSKESDHESDDDALDEVSFDTFVHGFDVKNHQPVVTSSTATQHDRFVDPVDGINWTRNNYNSTLHIGTHQKHQHHGDNTHDDRTADSAGTGQTVVCTSCCVS